MLATTKQALAAILSADPSITKEQQKAFLATATQTPQGNTPISRVIRREEAARILGISAKRVDQLARAGILKRVTLRPGASRSSGVTENSVRAIAEGAVA